MLTGCETDSYPDELVYPLRSDPLVTESLATEPPTIDRPGELGRILDIYLNPSERNKLLQPGSLSAQQRVNLDQALREVFRTPARPAVGEINDETRKALVLDEETLREGSRHYRHHCLHCHGLSGDGRGPTAPWVNPHPRDYRRGYFKFTSSSLPLDQRRARRADLLRVLREGIEDTSMPSFRLLPDDVLEALASYVIHLSLRGQVEHFVMDQVRQERVETDGIGDAVRGITTAFAGYWEQTQKTAIKPAPYVPLSKESVQRGVKLFLIKGEDPKAGTASASAGCISCHLDFGRASTYRFDDWGTIVRPANLTRGVYRGGRRPIDLYWRIQAGINGVGMPATNLQAKEGEPDPIWDLVNFLQVLPHPDKHAQYGIDIDTTLALGQGR